ncbi:hypothetical protein PN456_09290 [Nodularia spumigena CS-586/05]|uniref:hypothetical protein n=1 Tax=Nodularia spumigena TaxID=70799 RepID=UPI00232F07EE|nr:hypothetical protein [Nodularia spumigena]MDB9369150.1 hypothetical protein [Nodularia spumigena CS-586/05]
MSQASEQNKDEIPNKQIEPVTNAINYDWRDPSNIRNPEDDVIVDGWRRRTDGTFEKVENTEEKK